MRVEVWVEAVPGEAVQVGMVPTQPFAFLCFSEHLETKHLYIDFMSVLQDLNHKLSLQVVCWLKSCLRFFQGISVFYKY